MSVTRTCLLLLEKSRNLKQLKQTHAQIILCGLGTNSFVLSRILAVCSNPLPLSLDHAWQLFLQIEHPTVCICNTMTKAFLLNGELMKTIEMYKDMLVKRLYPDNYTIPYVLKACSSLRYCQTGEIIHGYSLKMGYQSDIFVGNTLMGMHSECGHMVSAAKLFDEIPERTAASWTVMISGYAKQGEVDTARLVFDGAPVKDRGIWGSMISGYVQNNCFKEGLQMFRLMQLMTDLELDEPVFASVLCACAHLGALDVGIWIHRYLQQMGSPLTVRLSTALIDMYAKCGNLNLAKKLFDGMQQRDLICWNAMISGIAMHGDGKSALELFSEMEKAGVMPDDITFIALFTACTYSGMAFEGIRLLGSMHYKYGMDPKSEHFGCIIDFLVRAGLFEEAKEIIYTIPNLITASEEAIAWRVLLSGYCDQGETQLAEVTAERLSQLECNSGAYVMLSNMYTATGNFNDAKRIRKMMKKKGIVKIPGCSSIVINGFVHEFIAGEKTHQNMDVIHMLLEKMNNQLES